MKKVTAAKNSKAKGKEVAREVERGNNSDDIIAGLPNGNAEELAKEDKTSTGGEEHDRDATVASYRTANEADDDDEEDDAESEEVSEQDGESSDDDGGGTEEDGDHTTSSSQAASSRGQRKRIGQSHDRSKRSHRAVQDIFREDSLTKVSWILEALHSFIYRYTHVLRFI